MIDEKDLLVGLSSVIRGRIVLSGILNEPDKVEVLRRLTVDTRMTLFRESLLDESIRNLGDTMDSKSCRFLRPAFRRTKGRYVCFLRDGGRFDFLSSNGRTVAVGARGLKPSDAAQELNIRLINPEPMPENDNGSIQCKQRLGGLLDFYHRGAS